MDPSEARSHATRDRILATARDLFHRQGFSAVGINTICRAAGVVKGSFYHFFPSKQALLEAVMECHQAELIEELEAANREAPDGRGRVLAQFSRLLDSAERQKAAQGRVLGCPIGALASETAAANEPARRASLAVFRAWSRLLAEQVRAGIADGSIAGSVDAESAALSLLAVIQGMSTLGRSFDDPALLRTIAQNTVKRLLPVGVKTALAE
jgi:TetR/AcrR family transcriptional repressor of nem operon